MRHALERAELFCSAQWRRIPGGRLRAERGIVAFESEVWVLRLNAANVAVGALCLFFTPQALAAEWFPCGYASQIPNGGCWLPSHDPHRYQYGVKYNTHTPQPVVCSHWNYGHRLHSVTPYALVGDDPSTGSHMAGVMFYRQTLAQDDDVCTGGTWRHQYWYYGADNKVTPYASHGCMDIQIFCRAF
ncbi:hypothetical protein [Myxococcus sp. AS-1-15]|uniref:hypothetical protein n=1 Tax=Myxococcus sp. AS-1-15 TaxID=2874600 RepID=UPI001CBF5021|nr:hypothetical protein [Myxococcus sp. AS-1-15]MBZ4402487.1 hypothetical protein [Myxococcus sp. AS-1-15]